MNENSYTVTLNSKLLHFGQELQFDRGRSFDEFLNRGPVEFNITLFHQHGCSSVLVHTSNFEPFGAKINFFGTLLEMLFHRCNQKTVCLSMS